ncbi:MAG: TonB-dependent receptor [Prevotellaceae bacterium]|jgi:iron complex outermembrane receptor protein|nr:TonB-dependent receptor [Prevotellaceae bacterium]
MNKKFTESNYLKLFAGIFAVFIFNAGNARILTADTTSSKQKNILDEAVVTGNKSLVNRNQVPMTISVVTQDEINAGSESSLLPVLSERVPGLFVTERGVTGFGLSAGSAGSLSIRGVGEGNKVLMLFDGQPQWAGIFGHQLPDTYATSDVERVEVVRGPASLLYGSNAMGGVVNMITRNPQEGTRINGRMMYGSYGTFKYMTNLSYKQGKISGIVSFNTNRTDGHRLNSAFEIYNGYAKVGYEINEKWKTSANILLAKFRSENPGAEDNPMLDGWVKALRGTASLSLDNKYAATDGSIKAFYNFGRHKVSDGWQAGGSPLDFLFNSDDYNAGAMIYQSFRPFKGSQLTAGLDFKRWGGHAWNKKNDGSKEEIIDDGVNEFAAYLLAQQDFWDKLTLNIGLRMENNEGYGAEWIPQAGAAFRLLPSTTLKASASRGFRSPNMRELYLYRPANADLKPEYLNNYEVSVLQRLFGDKMRVELTAFFMEGKNLIQVLVADGRPKNTNSGTFLHKGVELVVDYNFASWIRFSGNYSYLYMERPLLAAPKHQIFAGLQGNAGKFAYMLGGRYVGGLYLRQPSATVEAIIQNYFTINAKISYKPIKQLSLFVKGENLSNTKYSINNGFPMPGTVIFGGLDFSL